MPQDHSTTELDNRSEITLQDITEFIQKNFLLLFSTTCLTCLTAILISFIMTPIFQAELVAVSGGASSANYRSLPSSVAGIASLTGITLPSADEEDILESIAIAQSKKFNIMFVNSENMLPILFKKDWDNTNKSWKNNKKPTDFAAFLNFQNHYNISYETRDRTIRFTFNWDDPVIAATVANKFVGAVNKYTQDQVINEGEKSIVYLENSLSKTNLVGLRTVLFNLIEEQTQRIMLASVVDDYTFKIIDPALPPMGRIKPVRTIIAFIGLIFGIILGVTVALIKENFFTKKAD